MLESVNGSIDAGAGDSVDVKTVNGNIRVRVTRPGAHQAKLQAVNGSLEVALTSGVGARIEAKTLSGKIKSDFPLETSGKLVGSRANLTLGDGKTQVHLETVNGPIHIKKG